MPQINNHFIQGENACKKIIAQGHELGFYDSKDGTDVLNLFKLMFLIFLSVSAKLYVASLWGLDEFGGSGQVDQSDDVLSMIKLGKAYGLVSACSSRTARHLWFCFFRPKEDCALSLFN